MCFYEGYGKKVVRTPMAYFVEVGGKAEEEIKSQTSIHLKTVFNNNYL